MYEDKLNYENVEHLYVKEFELTIIEGLCLVEDGDGIMKILSEMNGDTDVLEFFTNHVMNAPIYA